MKTRDGQPAIQAQGAARLWVLLARDAPVGVVFRRGPRRQVQLVKWNLRNDRLESGQWFRGAIDLSVTDLSPDGRYLVYFAVKYGRRAGSWTAISKPPFFTALAVLPIPAIHGGGGLFLTDRRLRLNHPTGLGPAVPERLGPLEIVAPRLYPSLGPQVAERLSRDGWRLIRPGRYRPVAKGSSEWEGQPTELWERPHPKMKLTLQMETDFPGGAPGKQGRTYTVLSPKGETWFALDADWADWEATGALLFGHEGRLFRAVPRHTKLGEPSLVADFNADSFQEVPPPLSAQQW